MLSQQLFDLSWELVLWNDLPAWREHRDFYSGLSIIINQMCDFGQNHLAFTSPQLSHLPAGTIIPSLLNSQGFCDDKTQWYMRRYLGNVESGFIARWYMYYIFYIFPSLVYIISAMF